MAFYFASEINRRSGNEDSYCHMELRINHEAAVDAMVVADGMGGLSGGKQYSENAVQHWYEALLKTIMREDFKGSSLTRQMEILEEFSREIFEQINRTLYQKGLDVGLKGGTTLSVALHFWDTWILSNCGDSPMYIMKNGELVLASDIQNVAYQLVKEGKTVEGSSIYYQNKNRLLEYLGRREEVHPYCIKIPETEVDYLFVGSDGAFGNLTMQQIKGTLCSCEKTQDILKNLFNRARESGEEDNQTAILYVSEKAEREEMECYAPMQSAGFVAEPETLFSSTKKTASEEEICCYTQIKEERKIKGLREIFKKNCFKGGLDK